MADKYGKVAHICAWCGEDFHPIGSDHYSGPPMTIYTDNDGRQFCSTYCRDEANKEDD